MKKIILNLFKGYRDMEPTETTLEHIVKLIRQDAETAVHTQKHRTTCNGRNRQQQPGRRQPVPASPYRCTSRAESARSTSTAGRTCA